MQHDHLQKGWHPINREKEHGKRLCEKPKDFASNGIEYLEDNELCVALIQDLIRYLSPKENGSNTTETVSPAELLDSIHSEEQLSRVDHAIKKLMDNCLIYELNGLLSLIKPGKKELEMLQQYCNSIQCDQTGLLH